jgi:hypothetical protein
MAVMRGPVHLKRVTLDTTFVCTRAQPWKRGMCSPDTLVLHPDMVETRNPVCGTLGEAVSGECPNCGYAWPPVYRALKKQT